MLRGDWLTAIVLAVAEKSMMPLVWHRLAWPREYTRMKSKKLNPNNKETP